MISKRERNKIKKVLGGHYSGLVQEELHKKSIRNRNGHPHSKSQITNVMNGCQEDKEIEAAIYAAVETKNQALQAERRRRELILGQTKTGAVTPV